MLNLVFGISVMDKKVVFFPLAAPLAGILVGPVIDNIAAPLIKGVVKKIIGRGAPPRRQRQRHNYRIVYY